MVISNKPLRFILIAFIASLPLFGFANTPADSLKTATAVVTDVVEKVGEPKDEKAEIKEQIQEVIGHHLLDGHDFAIFQNGEAHYG